MANHKLILHRQNPHIGITDSNLFVHELRSIGFIAGDRKAQSNDVYFECGNRFLELINFTEERYTLLLGESGLEGVARNRLRCSVQLVDYGEKIWFHDVNEYTDNYPPCCPACGLATKNAMDVLSAWWDDKEAYRWVCPQCSQPWHIYDLDWGDGMAFVRCAIDIWHIHRDEAVPSQELLEFLQDKTGGRWQYYYYRF